MIDPFNIKPNPLHDYREEYSRGTGTMNTYRRMVDWMECPHLQAGDKLTERNNIRRKYGSSSAFVKSMLEGRFQRSDEYNLIYTDDDLKLMQAAMMGGAFKKVGDDVQAAGDISGGGDEQHLMIREGTEILLQDDHQCGNELDQADYWVSMLRGLGIPPWRFAVDGGGLGATVANYMETRLDYRGIKRCQANTAPLYKFEFRDKYTEAHFFIKELLSANAIKFKTYDKVLLRQARSRRYIEMELGEKLKTEPKPAHRQREKSSPDRLDTLIYLFYDFERHLLDALAGKASEDPAAVKKKFKTLEEISEEKSRGGSESGPFGRLRNMQETRDAVSASRRSFSALRIGQ